MHGTSRSAATNPYRAACRRVAPFTVGALLLVGAVSCMSGRPVGSDTPTGPGGSAGYLPPPPTGGGSVPAPTETDTVMAVPHIDQPGFSIASNFLGLSFEIWDALDAARLRDPALPRFLTNLGGGVLRYGGSTADQHCWDPATHNRCYDAPGAVVTNADLANVFAFSRATGWPVLYTVNLADQRPDTAAAEVQAVAAAGGTSLMGVEIGNEPDQYVQQGIRASGWGYPQYQTEWESYATRIASRTPSVKLAGLDGCCATGSGWLPSFVMTEQSRLVLATHHIYPTFNGAGSGTPYYPSIANLLDPLTTNRVASDVQQLVQAVGGRLPLRIDESNSVGGSGKTGVSDVYASSLWAVDEMFTLAENGAVGVNFHGSLSGGDYSPVGGGNGSYTAQPLYYAMLVFHTAALGHTLPVSITEHRNVAVHATLAADGSVRVTAINRESSRDVQIRIAPGRTFRSAGTLRLKGPSLSATSGITFAGASVSSDGHWAAGTYEPVYTQGGVYSVSVPAASVAVVTLVP
jgi:glycosyl hydrolase family 79